MAKKADREFNPGITPGPVETALRVFGPVKGLAAGPSGEVSPHFEEFVKKLAEKAGERRWQIMGARSQREATATYVQSWEERGRGSMLSHRARGFATLLASPSS